MNYNRFLNKITRDLKENPMMQIGEIARKNPDVISVANGKPDPVLFPFREAVFKQSDGTTLEIDEKSMIRALQYSECTGFSELVDWFVNWQKVIHNPPTLDNDHPGKFSCILDCGSLDGIYNSFECLVEDGDTILIQQPAYPGPTTVLRAIGNVRTIPLHTDSEGLSAENLKQALSEWSPSDASNPQSSIPKVLYCTPSCSNPTGVTWTLERKKAIYQIAREYNLLIFEDDAYYYLQYAKELVPSFLSMDTDGRVLRLDSLSKIIAPGLRVGIVSGPWPIVEKLLFRQQASINHPSGIAQMMIYKFLTQKGVDGFKSYLDDIRNNYKEKRDVCVKAAEKHLKGLVSWSVPDGGTFLWFKLQNRSDSYDFATIEAVKANILVIPGKVLMGADSQTPCPFIRVSYASATESDIENVFKKLASLLKSKQQ